jgi:hypothetical protein
MFDNFEQILVNNIDKINPKITINLVGEVDN